MKTQAQLLSWERNELAPALRRLREQNHVADAIIKIIGSSRE